MVETTNRMFGRYRPSIPDAVGVRVRRADEFQLEALRISDEKHFFSEVRCCFVKLNSTLAEALSPIRQGFFRYSKGSDRQLSSADASFKSFGPREKRHDGSRMSLAISVIEVISGWIIEIHGHLDK